MSTEAITLKHRDGRTVEAQATVRRYSAGSRTTKAAIILAICFTVGPATIVIPGVHFVAPWALPLMGIFIATYIYRRTAVIDVVEGTCPDCDAAMRIEESQPVGNETLYFRCPSCQTPLELIEAS